MTVEALESEQSKDRTRGRANPLVAEREGFEPTIRCYPYNGLASRRFQPLSHLSRSFGQPGER